MSDQVCAFCLGGPTEIPPFGTLKDAEDLIRPCSTCSLVTHRKCLVDWFNSIPVSQIQPVQEQEQAHVPETTANDALPGDVQEADGSIINISLQSRWVSILGQYSAEPEAEHMHFSGAQELTNLHVATLCPQCKSKIVFQVKRLAFIAMNSLLKSTIKDMVQYGGVFFCLSGAATGIVTMGYVGLARCGISMVDAIVPTSLISPLLGLRRMSSKNTLSGLMPSLRPTSADSALLIINLLKFQYVSILPVMLFRMRYLLPVECFFRPFSRILWAGIVSEILVCNYLLFFGNHSLAKQLYSNANVLLSRRRFDGLKKAIGILGQNIDWLNPNTMVGCILPARWLYDLLYKLTINKAHFRLVSSLRPGLIANSMTPEDLSKLEQIEARIESYSHWLSVKSGKLAKKSHSGNRLRQLWDISIGVLGNKAFFTLLRLKLIHWCMKTKACLQNDYSAVLSPRLAIMTGVTTFLWPFVSADISRLLLTPLLRRSSLFAGLTDDKLVFASNLIAMGVAAFAKDLANLFLSHQKASLLCNLTIIPTNSNQSRALQNAMVGSFPEARME